MRRTCVVAIVLNALLAGLAGAQTVDEIIARHVEARGGAGRLHTMRALRMTGRAVAGPGREALVSREILRPGRIRTEFTFQGATDVFVYDGTRGWYVSPSTGEFEPKAMSPENLASAAEQADIEGPLLDWRAKGHRVELIGKETVGDREAYRLRTTLASGSVRDDLLDAQSFLIVRTETTRPLRGQTLRLAIAFSDYRESGGLWFPHTIVSTAAGRPQALRIAIDSVEVNPTIDATRFSEGTAR